MNETKEIRMLLEVGREEISKETYGAIVKEGNSF